MGIARILIWNVFDSKTSVEELRRWLVPSEGAVWISNEPEERFGLIAFGELPDFGKVRELLGKDPEIAEEFDVEEIG